MIIICALCAQALAVISAVSKREDTGPAPLTGMIDTERGVKMGITEIIALFSGIALFLFGMSLMGDGLKKVAGSRLELILYRLSNTPLKGVLLGTGVTAVIQSSSATSIMVVGFVNAGMMKLRQAIGIILGAILGTSVTGWVISLSYLGTGSGIGKLLSTATLTGIAAVAGILLRMFSKKTARKRVGDILLGFAVLMFGMSTMSGAVSGLGEQEWFVGTLQKLSNPLLGILVGAAFTALLQSASAAVGIVQALSVTGAMRFEAALPLLMGIAIGAAFPVLLSALGAKTDGKRTALVYLVSEVVGVVICAALFYLVNAIIRFPFMQRIMNPFSLAFVNTVLRLAMVLLLLPFTKLLETMVKALVRGKADEVQPALRLEERFIAHPAIAIEQSRLTINDMAQCAKDALGEAFALLVRYSEANFAKVEQLEADGDRYEDALGTYLVKLTGRELTKQQNEDVSKYLHTITDFERISDHAMNIAESAKELNEKQISFSEEAQKELSVVCMAVREIMRLTMQAFVENDLTLAVQIEPLEELIDQLCDKVKSRHVERLQKGQCTIQQGFVLNDLLTSLERVGDHCSNVAVAMIELADDSFATHEYLDQLLDKQSPAFLETFDEYRERFSL